MHERKRPVPIFKWERAHPKCGDTLQLPLMADFPTDPSDLHAKHLNSMMEPPTEAA